MRTQTRQTQTRLLEDRLCRAEYQAEYRQWVGQPRGQRAEWRMTEQGARRQRARRQRTRQQRAKKTTLKVLAFLLPLVCLLVVTLTLWYGTLETRGTTPVTIQQPTIQTPIKTIQLDSLDTMVPVYIADLTDTRVLELINGYYPINNPINNAAGYWRVVPAYPAVPTLNSKQISLREVTLAAVQEMFVAANNAGLNALFITSAYRTYFDQQQIYAAASDKSFVQKPNHSEHQTGLAVDIFAINETESTMATSRAGQWLAQNSWKYGLIVRYDEGKQNITGISYEPWHFRFVGLPHAWFCQQNNLCFEEYIQYLKDNVGYQATLYGKTYTVLYQVPQNGLIYVPEGQNYSVSGDNMGGYIVTFWD